MAQPSTLKLDDSFGSYQELREAVQRYENTNRVQFWKRDTKRLHRVSAKTYEIVKGYPQLEYCSIRFACIHGGQSFRPKNILGLRKSRGTWKQDCKAEILVGLSEEKTRLVVKRIVEEHNHEIPTEEVFKLFPKKRLKTERLKVGQSHNLDRDKQNILDNLVRANSLARSNNLKRIKNILQEKYKCIVDLQSDEQDKVYGFFFQDSYMKKCFELFPEILLMDGTYKLLNIGCCIYVLSIENSLGVGDVVGIGVLTVENKTSIDWMVEKFKERNPKWEETTIVVTDKLTSQNKTAATHFPRAKRFICPSHVMHTFKRDVIQRNNILNVTAEECDACFDFFSRLSLANSEEEYQTILEDMEDSIPFPLTQLFFQNWHNLRKEWVSGLIGPLGTYIKAKFDKPNSKLKCTIGTCKTFSRFVENLFIILYTRRNEIQCIFTGIFTKTPFCDEESLAERKYHQNLTPYAFGKIRPHLTLSETKMTYDTSNRDSDVICETEEGSFVVSEHSCNCDFFTLLKLPCKHLLEYRKLQGMGLFDEYLFSKRWSRKYMQELFMKDMELPQQQGDAAEKNCEEKFEEAQSVCLALAGLCSEADTGKFEGRIDLLLKLQEFWRNGDEVTVKKSDDDGSADIKIDHDYVSDAGTERMELG